MCEDLDQFKPSWSGQVFRPLVEDVIVLTGPTASGKSSVALELAEALDGELLSLDSIAVYRKMDIGTAKPSERDRQRVAHHLIDLVDPNQDFSVACYLQAAHRAVDEIKQRKRVPIFVGGTPMFLKGILRGFNPGPPADWAFRNSIEADLKQYGVDALKSRLLQVDPLAAHRIHTSDTRRMIRALEFAMITGTPISHQQTQFESTLNCSECNVFTLAWPRDQLHLRINERVNAMFQNGLIDEVSQLLRDYGELSRTASQAVGYREIIAGLTHGESVETMMEEVAAHTRQLARRQETWFRSFDEIRSITTSPKIKTSEIVDQLVSLINS